MKKLITFYKGPLALIIFLLGVSTINIQAQNTPEHKPLVVFLVRHAEKVDSSRDPELSPEGKDRAHVLAQTLRSAGIEYIHSSDYIRTRETANPLAETLALDVNLYDPRQLTELANNLKEKGGTHLVVGHSNTTPALVKLLDCDPGDVIEESEYDRLYLVIIGKDGIPGCVLLRYGIPFDF